MLALTLISTVTISLMNTKCLWLTGAIEVLTFFEIKSISRITLALAGDICFVLRFGVCMSNTVVPRRNQFVAEL